MVALAEWLSRIITLISLQYSAACGSYVPQASLCASAAGIMMLHQHPPRYRGRTRSPVPSEAVAVPLPLVGEGALFFAAGAVGVLPLVAVRPHRTVWATGPLGTGSAWRLL